MHPAEAASVRLATGTPRHCMACNESEAIWDDLNDWHVHLV